MGGTASTLADLRREIDEIDRGVHDLLMRRASVVEATAAAKAEADAGGDAPAQIVYPAREAEIVRRLGARHRGRMPLQTVVQIWREIMAASVNLQRRMHVGVVESSADRVLPTARDHFGVTVSTRPFATAAALFEAVAATPDLIGLLPFPDSRGGEAPWWLDLASGAGDAARVVARLPFLKRNGGDALAVGAFDPGVSGADASLFVVETRAPLAAQPAALRILARAARGARAAALVEIDGDAAAADRESLRMAAAGGNAEVRHVGGYAVQLAA
ncbi:MAG: chorismate mutase [Alphaproteobacteria bacterium]|nr:chorismate mutase [Alphaproteobacteria bacterium]